MAGNRTTGLASVRPQEVLPEKTKIAMKGVSGMDPGKTDDDNALVGDQVVPPGVQTSGPTDVDVTQLSYMDAMMQDAVRSGQPCSIFLVNGVKLQGKVIAVDALSLLMQNNTGSSEPFGVNRAAVATFVPGKTSVFPAKK